MLSLSICKSPVPFCRLVDLVDPCFKGPTVLGVTRYLDEFDSTTEREETERDRGGRERRVTSI